MIYHYYYGEFVLNLYYHSMYSKNHNLMQLFSKSCQLSYGLIKYMKFL